MNKQKPSTSAFFSRRALLSVALFLSAGVLAVFALTPSSVARRSDNQLSARPDVVSIVGPVSMDADLHDLPVIPGSHEEEERRLMRYPKFTGSSAQDPVVIARRIGAAVSMPSPALLFNGINSTESGCGCLPPDTNGDVGPNHFIQSVNSSIKIFSKTGAVLLPATTYNSFFSGLAASGTPCGLNQNDGDGIVFYDHMADRWVVSDFAFPAFPGVSFYQCIGVSKTNDPVSGGWWLYAVQVDPSNPNYLGDYPKFAVWPDAWFLTMNMFSNNTTFNGVRVYALPRAAMINGTGAPNTGAIGFTIDAATLGDTYSLVPATFRTGSLPPAGRDEYLLAVDSPSAGGVVQNKVHTWRCHVDFNTPANSTLGVGATHTANGEIAVNNFVDAYTSTTVIVPQNGTTRLLDTLGDKIMTPVVYQNLNGVESLWAVHTINNNQAGTGPTAIRWYQFNVTGGVIPAAPAQQQTFNNAADGLWRFMPSIAVDAAGNMAIGYSTSGSTLEPSVRWAGRLANDPPSTLGQGEAVMQAGGGHQTSSSGRWGDYSYMDIDPVDNLTFWHTNEYFSATSSSSWNTTIGKFRFSSGPIALSAVSRKTHGAMGTFDINLPLTGTPGIEDRQGAVAGSHQIVVSMNANVSVASASASPAPANVNSMSVNGSKVTLNLTGVADASKVMLTLTNVNDGVATGNVTVPVWFLLGDANADMSVNAADAQLTRNRSGMDANAITFRSDVNADGMVDSADATILRANSGNFLP